MQSANALNKKQIPRPSGKKLKRNVSHKLNELKNFQNKAPSIGEKIKDNGIDKRVGNGVVYRSYMSHYQPALDMPQIL